MCAFLVYMTTWNDSTPLSTAWNTPSDPNTSWGGGVILETAWGTPSPYSVTVTYAYPIGITLVFTHNVSTTTTYPTSSDMEWTDQNNTQTAWR